VDADVVIAGGGPTGLMLACELRLAGIRPVVLERLTAPTGLSKALALVGRSVDALDYRGLLDRFRARAAVAIPGAAHFALIPLDLSKLGDLGLRGVFIQQAATEEILRGYASELDVQVRAGCELTAVRQDADGVDVEYDGPRGRGRLRAQFLVGCDGGASTVRKQAGIDFPGLAPTVLLRLGDVTLEGDLTPDQVPGVRVPLIPLGAGFYRVITTEPYPAELDRDAPMTLDELRASIRRVNGRDLPISGTRWVSRFTDSSRQAARYRAGRVLLAGDAAHIHLPAGGPGLNAGLLDAVNLGWKLAAEVRGWAPPGLLDSYHTERHADGERVLLHTRAQGALVGAAADGRVAALREVVAELGAARRAEVGPERFQPDHHVREHLADHVVDVTRHEGVHRLVGQLDCGPGDPQIVGLGVMAYHGTNDHRSQAADIHAAYLADMKRFARWLVDCGRKIRLTVGDGPDNAIAHEIVADLRAYRPDLEPSWAVAEPVASFADLTSAMAPVGLVVATRYHNVICALRLGKPVISLGYSAKNQAVMAGMGLAEFCQVAHTLDVDQLTAQFTALEQQSAQLRETIIAGNAASATRLREQFTALSALLFAGSGPARRPARGQVRQHSRA